MVEDEFDPASADLSAVMKALFGGAAFQTGEGATLKDIANQSPDIVRWLGQLNPVQTAATFGSLLTIPALQANCLRLETLTHMALAFCNGRDKPSDSFVATAFRKLGEGFCGLMEDPAEDVFVSAVRTPRGNFRVLEGVWEGAGFYLQRFINVIEGMPEGQLYQELRDSVYALLALSDLVCERARLQRHQLGGELPLKQLDRTTAISVGAKRSRIRFSLNELEQAGIPLLPLTSFIFGPNERQKLEGERLGASTLERFPLIRDRNHIYLILPTAVSAAIRYHVINLMHQAGLLSAFRRSMAHEYAELFSTAHLLGGRPGAPISFQSTDHGAFSGVLRAVDRGRYLNIIFFTDHLTDFQETGLAGMNPDCHRMGTTLKAHIDHAHKAASSHDNFVDGISLVVGCGVGRGSGLLLERDDYPHWRVQFISAYDLDVLSWTPDFKPLSLWRLLDAGDRVEALGTTLQNINGLLNLVAWTRSLEGHLVPHGNLPDDFSEGERATFLMINQNSLRELRHEVVSLHDPRVVQDADGQWIPVRRDQQSDFADDRAAPLYGSEIINAEGRPMSVYLTPTRAWWAEVSLPKTAPGALAYERWRMVTVWLSRSAPILDRLTSMPVGPVKWRAEFRAMLGDQGIETGRLTYEEARAAIAVNIDRYSNVVTTIASERFEDAIYHQENIAERALVDAMISGILELSGQDKERRYDLLQAIVPNTYARHAHAFAPRSFRDFVHRKLQRNVIKINRDDDAAMRLGLGWSVRDQSLGGNITGKADTIAFLNSLVTSLEEALCQELRAFNRDALLNCILINYESAAFDRDKWQRTAAAVLALHPDTASTLETMADHDFKLNAVFQASRILAEMAICESPLVGGRQPGELDLSRLMAKAILLFHLGGWSDAIRWDVMEPTIRVTPLGDVHAKFDYIDEIITPHAREANEVRIRDSADNYSQNLEHIEGTRSIAESMDERFLDAWQEEFGAPLQDMRVFIDWLENRGIAKEKAILRMSRKDFVDIDVEGQVLSPEVVSNLLSKLALSPRLSWRQVPEGFEDRDRQPWRFRRRLSLLRRPLLRLGEGEEGHFLVAPGLVREAFAYTVSNYMRGDFPSYQLGPKMKAWAAQASDIRGAAFTKEVAAKLKALGWQAETEVKLTKILGRRLDKDYGDVDVLAWHQTSERILIIECKDVQYRKTFGEIAEQLADFRGELRPNGKPDYLLRHLNRLEMLSDNISSVCAYVGIPLVPKLGSFLVFKNPVPMKYALTKLAEKVVVCTFSEIDLVLSLDSAS
ncbi:MAG TPA: hypothetical protein VD978_26630 [Azospirillum sp.]|nr:hypothetical protein [Azospirillum sp.]